MSERSEEMENHQIDRPNKKLKYGAISTATLLVTALVLVQPAIQTSYAQVSDLGAPAFDTCAYFPVAQPEDPYTVNSIRGGKVALTVIAEKEIFECQTVQGDLDVIVDVTVYGEIYENMTSRDIIVKQAFVVTCVKIGTPGGVQFGDDATYQVLGCDTYRPLTDFIPVSYCRDIQFIENWNDAPLEEPQEMNTVNKNNIVKTIEIEKEIVYCDFNTNTPGQSVNFDADEDDKKVEQYIIQETWRNLNLLPADPIIEQHVESLRCWTLVTTALVESCQFTTVPLQEVDPFE
ncbi:MAG: hypothetical protein ACRD38_10700 [Nitrososphaerales archaeon]